MIKFFYFFLIFCTLQSVNSQTTEELDKMYQRVKYLEQKEDEAQRYIFGTRDYITNLIIDNFNSLGSENYKDLLNKEKFLWYRVDRNLEYYKGNYVRFLRENHKSLLDYKNQMLSFIKSKLPTKTSCKEAVKYVKNNFKLLQVKDRYELESNWLKKVSLYYDEKNDKNIVIAEMYIDNKFNEYIFCSIDYKLWNDFAIGGFNLPKSYGERFWRTIMDMKCNCE